MYNYTAYNLNISSAVFLPELQTSTHQIADVIIKFGKIGLTLPQPEPTWDYFHLEGDSAYLYWKVVGKFLVKSGREIIIDPLPDVEERVLRLPLLGAVLAMLLHQRQYLVLHASAMVIGDSAAVFLGPKGQGKSTMAATLYGRGHKQMTDDAAAININNYASPILLPGFPQIKLWPEAATVALGDNPEKLRKIHPEVEKRARPTVENFLQKSLPLKRVYILSQGSDIKIKPLQIQEAVTKLIANSYIPMLLGKKFLQSETTALHLRQCTHIAKNTPIYSLERPRSLDLLPKVAQLVEEDLAS